MFACTIPESCRDNRNFKKKWMLALHQKTSETKRMSERNINNIIAKKRITYTYHWKKKKKKVKCDSELYVIMVYSTWGNCVPDSIQYVILCKFNHEDILSCTNLTMQTIGTTKEIALKKKKRKRSLIWTLINNTFLIDFVFIECSPPFF